MRGFVILIISSISFSVFSQELDTLFFFIDKNDTLIKKQIATRNNKFEGYTIINENKTIKKHIRSSKIDGDDIVVDAFDTFSFTFNRDNGFIIDKTKLGKYDIIKTRKEFFEKSLDNDIYKKRIVFIEPLKCNRFILREVRPIISE